MDIFLQLAFSGIALGMIYAVIAFGYQLTFATSGTLNFGQGEALMLGALVGLSLVSNIHGGPYMGYLLMIPIVIVFGALQGVFVEWIGVRPAIKIKSEFGWIMSTIALAIIFKNVAENIWGKDDLPFPSPLSTERMVKYIANNAAKNMSSDDSHTIVPTLTRLGRLARVRGALSVADTVATASIITAPAE